MPQPMQSEPFSTPANCAACRRSIRQGSQSFYVASLLLPVAVREPAYAIYAFCRMADDLIDRDQGGSAAIEMLGRMLDRIYARRPGPSFVERGFADVVDRFGIPRAVPDALIEGLAWDAAGRSYQTLDDLKAYAVRVAGTVGFMMTLAMGRREPHVLARACDLGVAMQLTNIARDVGEDAANGRLYLPRRWLADAGIDAERWLAAPISSPEIRSIVARLLGEADGLYDRAESGIVALPSHSRLGINVARILYRQIGHEILGGIDPLTTRAVTTKQQKLRLVAGAIWTRAQRTEGLYAPCVAEAQFLIDAVGRFTAPRPPPAIPAWWNVAARSIRMIDLLNGFSSRDAAKNARRLPSPAFSRSSSIVGPEQ
jgi:phytoene synthase